MPKLSRQFIKKLQETSTRFCSCCQQKTTWKLDPDIGHSCCQTCGADSRYAHKNRHSARPLKLKPKSWWSTHNLGTKIIDRALCRSMI